MGSHRIRTLAAVGAAALAAPLLATTTGGVTPAFGQTHATSHHATTHHATSGRVAVKGTQPLRVPASRVAGRAPARAKVSFEVALTLRHAAAAQRLAQSVSSPKNASYGHFLTTKQFYARFAPSKATVAKVSRYLRAHGLRVVGHDRHAIQVRGSVRAISRTFHTGIRNYRSHGHLLRTLTRKLTLPRAIGRHVLTVSGLQQAFSRRPNTARATEPTTTTTPNAPPGSPENTPPTCSAYWDQNEYTMPQAYGRTQFPTYICGYVPSQLRSAYGTDGLVASGQTGKGTKVAIIDAYGSSTILSDANTYATNHGEPAFTRGQFNQKLFQPFNFGDLCGTEGGWNGEETLDVEAVHAMAPGAKVLYVGGQNCAGGIDYAQQWIVDNAYNPNSKAYGTSIVSNSYGYPGEIPGVIVEPAVFVREFYTALQGAIEGIGFYFSSGDEGDNLIYGYSDIPQPQWESSDPLVTGVGGTSLAVDANGGYLFETGWGSSLTPVAYDDQGNQIGYQIPTPGNFLFGAGGGTSTIFEEPWYQQGIVPDALARAYDGTRNRVAPDVSLDADPYTGFLIGESDPVTGVYAESGIGGTSLSTPLMAGLQALVQGNHGRLGFASPILYALGSGAYRDVVPPASPVATPSGSGHNLVTFDHDSSLFTAPGYDNVTGLGTPYGTAFVDAERAYLQ